MDETEDQRLSTLKEVAAGLPAEGESQVNSDAAWNLVRGTKGFENPDSPADMAFVREHWPRVYAEALAAKKKEPPTEQPAEGQ